MLISKAVVEVEAPRRHLIELALALIIWQATLPNVTFGALANPDPVTVTSVPACDPVIGLTLVTCIV